MNFSSYTLRIYFLKRCQHFAYTGLTLPKCDKSRSLAKKRTTIKGNDDTGLGSDLRVVLDFDVDVTKDIISRERQCRTRTTVLQSAGKVNVVKLNYITACSINKKP